MKIKMIRVSVLLFLFSRLLLLSGLLVPGGWQERGATNYLALYTPVARDWLDGCGWTMPGGEPAVLCPSGFPTDIMLVCLAWLDGQA